MKIVFRPEAEEDLAVAVEYCAHGGSSASTRFIHRLDDRLKLLQSNPEIAPKVYSRFHRLLLHPYPFGLFFHVVEDRIIVIAILDLRQNPESIRSRLTGQ